MNHDYAHCADYKPSCPAGCFRGELVRDLRCNPMMVGVPVSWSHFEGTDECLKKIDVPIYDKVEVHENCTVQVLVNTNTGDVSVGWWQNE